MAGKFHAIFRQVAQDDQFTMELIFDDAPWNDADILEKIEVTLFERDKSLGGKIELSEDDRLGVLTLDLRREKGSLPNAVPLIKITKAFFNQDHNDGRVNSGTFLLRAGSETFRISVFMEKEEWPHAEPPLWALERTHFIELGMRIEFQNKIHYNSLIKDIRCDRLPRLLGPVITIIALDKAGGDAFGDNAENHWLPRSDVLIRPQSEMMSLEEIFAALESDSHGSGEWGQVNIVTHGNLSGLFLPLRANQEPEELTEFNVSELHVSPLKSLRKGFSHIVIRGCSIGRDIGLLNMLSKKFSGCQVHAPKSHLMAYHTDPKGLGLSSTNELLYRRYWAFTPGNRKSNNRKIIAKLLNAQKTTMPLQPRLPFKKMVTKEFKPNGAGIPDFFRRKDDVQTVTLSFPEGEKDRLSFLKSELKKDPGLRNGRTHVTQFLQTKEGIKTKAGLTQPDHQPLPINDLIWKNLDAWILRGHWKLKAENIKDEVSPEDKQDPDPIHNIRAKATLSRVKVEACELHGEITDLDVNNHPEFGHSTS